MLCTIGSDAVRHWRYTLPLQVGLVCHLKRGACPPPLRGLHPTGAPYALSRTRRSTLMARSAPCLFCLRQRPCYICTLFSYELVCVILIMHLPPLLLNVRRL